MTPHFLISFLKSLPRVPCWALPSVQGPVHCGDKSCFYKQFFGVFFLEWNCFARLSHFPFGDTKEHEFPFSWYLKYVSSSLSP